MNGRAACYISDSKFFVLSLSWHFSLHLIFLVIRASPLTTLGDFNRSALYDVFGVFGASDVYFFSVDGFAPRWRL